ncbi:MAG TPA: prenyltransferase [Polyangia bacterium]
MDRLVAFVRLGRPQFLIGGFLLYGLGAAVAVVAGATLAPRTYLLGQAAITTIQLMTHYANDFFDIAADRANQTPTRWSGGSRVLTGETSLAPRVALRAARTLAALALLIVGAVFLRGGPGGPVAALALLVALGLAWAYSAPPARLHSRGLGELTTAIVVTGLTPLVGFVLQAGGLAGVGRLMLAQGPLIGLQFCMLLAIEFPDAAGDAIAGKRTLVVRLGGPVAAALYRALLVLTYGGIPLLIVAGLPPIAALGAASLAPLAAWQFGVLGGGGGGDARRWEGLAFRAVAMLVVTSAAELAAFVWLARS